MMYPVREYQEYRFLSRIYIVNKIIRHLRYSTVDGIMQELFTHSNLLICAQAPFTVNCQAAAVNYRLLLNRSMLYTFCNKARP